MNKVKNEKKTPLLESTQLRSLLIKYFGYLLRERYYNNSEEKMFLRRTTCLPTVLRVFVGWTEAPTECVKNRYPPQGMRRSCIQGH